ncbi:hypothetical protein C2857_005021 [Epichloe festucae Fl1]|uniref:Uncharacterized protein n=1 Tax=Epichloe festucae (strain Fl1) TaxID=877507 RepID=A0A7S9KPE8_EPIFF|nr:hypothetical protein C2857_005021 [Epichloe festucae Fl1]
MKSINSLLLSLAVLGMNMGSEAHPSGLSQNSSDTHVTAGTLVKRAGSDFSKTCRYIKLVRGNPRFLQAHYL